MRFEYTEALNPVRGIEHLQNIAQFFFNSLRDFLKTSDKARKCLQGPLPKHIIEICCRKSKDNLFAPYYKNTIGNPFRQTGLPNRFGNNDSRVFSIKKRATR